MNAISVSLLVALAFLSLLAALGHMDETIPDQSGPGIAVTLLALTCFWLSGGLWMGYCSRWGWALGFWFAMPLALPLYVYKASRGTGGTSGNRFPVFRTTIGIWLLAAAMYIGTEVVSTESSGPEASNRSSGPLAKASPISQGPSIPQAWFDPDSVTRVLLDEPFYSESRTGCEEYDAEPWDEEIWDAFASVSQECDFGGVEFIIFETDREADEAVVELQGSRPTNLPGYSHYETAAWFEDDYATFYVAVGNIVVDATAGEEWIVDYGYEGVFPNPESAATVLAGEAIERLIDLGGAPQGSAGTAM